MTPASASLSASFLASPSAAGPRWPGLLARIGQGLLAPRAAAARVIRGGPGGVRDAALLLAFRVCAHQLPLLTRGVLRLSDEGPAALWPALEPALLSARTDLVLILAGGVLLSLLTGPGERLLRPGLGVELAAQAWLGFLAVQLGGTLFVTLLPTAPRPLPIVLTALSLGAFAALWIIALLCARRAAQAALASQGDHP